MLSKMAGKVAGAMEGYRVKKLDALALLQHYGWPTALLDWTSSFEVAVWFALFDAKPSRECIVYRIDLSNVQLDQLVRQIGVDEILASWQIKDAAKKLLLLDHSFLTQPLGEGGKTHRWLRQAGFAITIAEFDSPDAMASFDLLRHPVVAHAIESHRFRHVASDRSLVQTNLYALYGDPIPARLQELIPSFVEPWIHRDLCDELQTILSGMPLPRVPSRVDD